MSLKKWKKIVAQTLVVAIMLPNVNVKATTQQSINTVVEKQQSQEEVATDGVESGGQAFTNFEGEIIENEEQQTSDVSNVSQENLPEVDESQKDESNEIVEPEITEAGTNAVQDAAKETEQTNENDESTQNLQGKKYTSKKVAPIMSKAYSREILEDEPMEFKLKREALEELTVLEKMTDLPYEVALAYSDGSYSYVGAFNTLEEAIDSAKNMPMPLADESVLPSVIDARGQVVYSTNSVARIIKYVDNKNVNGNSNMYLDSSLTKAFTYINQGYVDDAPVLEDKGTSARVLVNGNDGWMNKNTASGNYDIVVYPVNQVTNPSYYTVKSGELVHYISSNLIGTSGFSRVIGKAPSYLREGVRYLSYDGTYFYDGSNIEVGLNALINDYKAGNRSQAVNSATPHYLYYQTLPFRSKTIYSADDLNRFINAETDAQGKSNSKLKNIGGALKDAEAKYGVNALLTLGVAINESGWGTSKYSLERNNLFGMNAFDSNPDNANWYATPGDSVLDFTKEYISRGYSDPADWRYFGGFLGNKNRGANVKYASDPFWGEKAASYAYQADKYLSGGVNQLRDTNSYQIAMAKSNNAVIKKDGTLLYNVTNDLNQYAGYINTPFIISNLGQVNINGENYYEIYPERNTPVGNGGTANKFSGNYDWNSKGYIKANDINLINGFRPTVEVRGGIDRYATAVELSKSAFNLADTVVIANGYAMADGLAATPLATYYNGPLLLTESYGIPAVTRSEITRLGAKNAIIVGGTGVVGTTVENQLRELGITKITRLGGQTRYETALYVAKYIDKNLYDVANIVVTNGYGEADALSIAPVSGRDKMPIILVEDYSVSKEVYNWLRDENLNNAFIVGGTGVVSNSVLDSINKITVQDISGNRLGGIDRYETNAAVINRFYGTVTEKVYIAKGVTEGLVDALSSGPVAALNGSPIVLADWQLTQAQKNVLANRTTNVIVRAGHGIPTLAVNNLVDLLSRTK